MGHTDHSVCVWGGSQRSTRARARPPLALRYPLSKRAARRAARYMFMRIHTALISFHSCGATPAIILHWVCGVVRGRGALFSTPSACRSRRVAARRARVACRELFCFWRSLPCFRSRGRRSALVTRLPPREAVSGVFYTGAHETKKRRSAGGSARRDTRASNVPF